MHRRRRRVLRSKRLLQRLGRLPALHQRHRLRREHLHQRHTDRIRLRRLRRLQPGEHRRLRALRVQRHRPAGRAAPTTPAVSPATTARAAAAGRIRTTAGRAPAAASAAAANASTASAATRPATAPVRRAAPPKRQRARTAFAARSAAAPTRTTNARTTAPARAGATGAARAPAAAASTPTARRAARPPAARACRPGSPATAPACASAAQTASCSPIRLQRQRLRQLVRLAMPAAWRAPTARRRHGVCRPDQPAGGTVQPGFPVSVRASASTACAAATSATGPARPVARRQRAAAANGVCGPVATGTDPDNDCPVDPAERAVSAPANATGPAAASCYGLGTVCGAATCSGSTLTGQQCNGSGIAPPVSPRAARPTSVRARTAAAPACSTNADCVGGNFCIGGVCTPTQAERRRVQHRQRMRIRLLRRRRLLQHGLRRPVPGLQCAGPARRPERHLRAGAAGTDPHDDCADDGAQSCDLDGTCNGAGQCASYANGAPCGQRPASTTPSPVKPATVRARAGATRRFRAALSCASNGACTTICTTFADCSDECLLQ